MACLQESYGITACEFCGIEEYKDKNGMCGVCCDVGEVGWELGPFGSIMLYVIN